ncbi:cytochrome P450 [Rhizodiscina lignyota]|uniref:Cytochrome P450 n=1 Tax=Rhizodiscina lignyota TaxID=1504668 RepID=A0A9P4I4N0_9PEZI|nr:cytochrome P450 [Rhizodiscina lignyota]
MGPFLLFAGLGAILLLVLCARRIQLLRFPGPIVAKVSDSWRFNDVLNGHAHETALKLHNRLGTAVRMGPNTLSLSDPEVVKTVYSMKVPWKKSNFYSVADIVANGNPMHNLFSSRDEEWHEHAVRPIRPLYSMTKVLELEPRFDQTINLLLQCFDQAALVCKNAPCPLDLWVGAFTLDLNSNATFGKHGDFLRQESDLRDINTNERCHLFFDASKRQFQGVASLGQMPMMDYVIGQKAFWRKTKEMPDDPLPRLVAPAVRGRQMEKPTEMDDDQPPDLLSRFIGLMSTHPQVVYPSMVFGYSMSQLVAGSDTTASAILSTVYHTLKHPQVKEKLQVELCAADLSTPAQWYQVRNLKYLNAVISEAMRMTPGVGLVLERVVPAGGFTLPDGRYVPAGTIVGMNPWVLSRTKAVYGEDADHFNPERWLQREGESTERFKERERRMRDSDLGFGHGPRSCIGKSFALLVVHKLIATLFSVYDMELLDPDKEWKIQCWWFVYVSDVNVTLQRRK